MHASEFALYVYGEGSATRSTVEKRGALEGSGRRTGPGLHSTPQEPSQSILMGTP